MTPEELTAIEARDATIRDSWIDMWRDDIRPGMLAICDRRDLLAEVKRLRAELADAWDDGYLARHSGEFEES